jgi:hypothetical protein
MIEDDIPVLSTTYAPELASRKVNLNEELYFNVILD